MAQLQAVTLQSIPEEVKLYEIRDEVGEDGIRRTDAVAGVEGIGKVALFLDASALPQEDIHWFHLFTAMLGESDTAAHTRSELAVLMERYLYSAEIRLSLMGKKDDYHPRLRLGWIGMDEDLATAYDLMYEIVFDTQFDAGRVSELISKAKASLKSSLTNSIYSVQLYRALAVDNALYRYYNYYNFIEYYQFLEQVEQLMAEEPEAVLAKLTEIQTFLRNSSGAVAGFAGSEESIAVNRPLADAFLARLDRVERQAVQYELPVPAAREGIVVDSAVQFNALVAGFGALNMEDYDAGLEVVSAAVNDVYLLPLLRDQYGAYSIFHSPVEDGGVYIISYRDPNVAETFAVYDSLPELIGQMTVDQDTLDGYILSVYSGYAQSSGELTGAVSALTAILNGDSQEDALTYMKQLKAVTPETLQASVAMYQKLVEKGVRSTAGSASAITANADLYDVILNPFGTVDASEVAFEDAPEGSEHYDEIRYVFEEGLMAPVAEGVFGSEEQAKGSDLASALYVLLGGPLDTPDDAVAFLTGNGLAPADLTVDTALTAADAQTVLDVFSQAVGVPFSSDEAADDQPLTRRDLAVVIATYVQALESRNLPLRMANAVPARGGVLSRGQCDADSVAEGLADLPSDILTDSDEIIRRAHPDDLTVIGNIVERGAHRQPALAIQGSDIKGHDDITGVHIPVLQQDRVKTERFSCFHQQPPFLIS